MEMLKDLPRDNSRKRTMFYDIVKLYLTLSRRRPLSYRNQSLDLLRKSMDWLLYDNGRRLERVNSVVHLRKFEFFSQALLPVIVTKNDSETLLCFQGIIFMKWKKVKTNHRGMSTKLSLLVNM